MKALFVRKLYLWPRFEVHVKDTLNDLPIEVRRRASAGRFLGIWDPVRSPCAVTCKVDRPPKRSAVPPGCEYPTCRFSAL